MTADPERLSLFAATAPGLEAIAAGELRALGARSPRVFDGGVTFTGSFRELYHANLSLRTVSRILVRFGEFHASEFYELERRTRRLPWERFLVPGRALRLRVTCRKSRLYHSDAVAERVSASIRHRLGKDSTVEIVADEESDAAPSQLVVVRLAHDECTVSVDSSGIHLHMRGYRQAVAKAPLRETLAAALLLAGEWPGDVPLMDPLCGSGTIAIEAALIARRIPPGLRRRFAFMEWPGFGGRVWSELVARAMEDSLSAAPAPILASDRDAGAIAAATSNAERAGVANDIQLKQCALSAVEFPPSAGWVVTNPPYGARVGDPVGLRDLYAALGNVLRKRGVGWRLVMLAADRKLEAQAGMKLRTVLSTANGGIPVRGVRGDVANV